jgi:hypothetical protein
MLLWGMKKFGHSPLPNQQISNLKDCQKFDNKLPGVHIKEAFSRITQNKMVFMKYEHRMGSSTWALITSLRNIFISP